MVRDLFELGTPSQSVTRSGHSTQPWVRAYVSPEWQASLQGFYHRRRHAFLVNCLLKISVSLKFKHFFYKAYKKIGKKTDERNKTKKGHPSSWQIRARGHAVTNKMWPSQVFSVISTVNRDKGKLSDLYLRQVMLNQTTQCAESRHQPALSQMSSS